MNYIFIIICSIILPILSLKNSKPKLCINCKHFIPGSNGNNIYAKCALFKKEEKIKQEFLVTGIIEKKETDYYYCSTARSSIASDMCGEKGKHYKKKRIIKDKVNDQMNG